MRGVKASLLSALLAVAILPGVVHTQIPAEFLESISRTDCVTEWVSPTSEDICYDRTLNEWLYYDGGTWRCVAEQRGIIDQACPPYTNAGLVEVADAAMTAASCNLDSASAAFVTGDVGKSVQVAGAATGPALLVTSIATYVSATRVTTTDCADLTVSSAKMQFFTDFGAINTAALAANTKVTVKRATRPYGVATSTSLNSNNVLVIEGDIRAAWQDWGAELTGSCRNLFCMETVNDVTIRFEGGSVDGQSHENPTGGFIIFFMDDVTGIDIVGNGTIREAAGVTAAGGASGDAIYMTGDATTCLTDDVYIGNGLTLDANVRQGITVICGKNITVANMTIQNTSGTDPGLGIDGEPNVSTQGIEGLKVSNVAFINNNGGGFLCQDDCSHVSLTGNYFKNNGSTSNHSDVVLKSLGAGHIAITGNTFDPVHTALRIFTDVVDFSIIGNVFWDKDVSATSAGILIYDTGNTNAVENGSIVGNTFRDLAGRGIVIDQITLGTPDGVVDGVHVAGNKFIDVEGGAGTGAMMYVQADTGRTVRNVVFSHNECIDTRSGGNEADACLSFSDQGGTHDVTADHNISTGPALNTEGIYNRTDDWTTGITAFAGGGQTNGTILTTRHNEVSTVASTNDSLRAAAALPGRMFSVMNTAANDLHLFPDVGDDLGAGVNVQILIAAGAGKTFFCYDATNCREQ